jgi:hypothetical protein
MECETSMASPVISPQKIEMGSSEAGVPEVVSRGLGRRFWALFVGCLILITILSAVGLELAFSHKTKPKPNSGGAGGPTVTVEVVKPQTHGIDRICAQPGTVESLLSNDLYA